MKTKLWHHILIWISIPLLAFLYYNQAANWHYHVTSSGVVVEHAHPFTNSQIPGTPYQEHEHSDFEYLVLAQLMHTIGWIVLALLLLGMHFPKISHAWPLHHIPHPSGIDPDLCSPRGPPSI